MALPRIAATLRQLCCRPPRALASAHVQTTTFSSHIPQNICSQSIIPSSKQLELYPDSPKQHQYRTFQLPPSIAGFVAATGEVSSSFIASSSNSSAVAGLSTPFSSPFTCHCQKTGHPSPAAHESFALDGYPNLRLTAQAHRSIWLLSSSASTFSCESTARIAREQEEQGSGPGAGGFRVQQRGRARGSQWAEARGLEAGKGYQGALSGGRRAEVRRMSTRVMQQGKLRVYLQSPGMIADPYQPSRPKLPVLKRWLTWGGWREIRQDVIEYLKTAYTVAKLRQHNRGFTQKAFYREMASLYTQINKAVAKGDQTALRQLVTETVFTAMKREIRQREEAGWARLDWETSGPVTSLKTAQARLVAVDPKNTDNAFAQLTIVIRSNQKYAAYNRAGKLVAGERDKEVLVEDIWVFERPLLHPEVKWRLCGRIGG